MAATRSESVPAGDAATAPVLLSLRGVGKTYRTGEVEVPVLHGVDLDVREPELMVIVGPSGSGKSTLLNVMGGLDSPSEGTVAFDGRTISDLGDRELTRYRRRNVGFVFQFYNLIPTLTALENVVVSTEIAAEPLDARDALDLVGLRDRVDHFPSQMSGGEQQRVAIARAIAKNPRLLLCDEPTGALDLATGRNVLGILGRLRSELGKAVVIITHNMAIAAMAESVVRIGSGTIAELRRNPHPASPEEIHW